MRRCAKRSRSAVGTSPRSSTEIVRIEITLTADGVGFTAHGHVTGSHIDVATHATATKLLPAAEKLLVKLERQLRRVHDKRIFAKRREAQRKSPKRLPG